MSLVEIRDISVRFGGVHALDSVSVDIEHGRLTAVIGPNGAGKTTLMNVLSGMTRPDGGTVRFRDHHVTGRPAHRIAALGMSRTFQNIELFDTMTVRENVLVGRHLRMRAGLLSGLLRLPRHFVDERQAARAVGELIERLELTDVADEPVTGLPYGLQRRVELARALASEPVLLLLDEPMAGLTRGEIAEVGQTIRELMADGLSVLLVEHAIDAVMMLSDEVIVLDRGALLATGTPREIQADERVIAAYLGDEEEEIVA